MKTPLLILLAVLIAAPCFAGGSHYRRGYTKKSGTYVPGGHQTNSDDSRFNNWSSKGNYNPYTGKKGTVDPFKPRK